MDSREKYAWNAEREKQCAIEMLLPQVRYGESRKAISVIREGIIANDFPHVIREYARSDRGKV